MNRYAQNLLAMLEELSTKDFQALPNTRFIYALRKKLMATLSIQTAESVVNQMKVSICEDLDGAEEFIETASTAYAQMIDKIYQGYIQEGFHDPDAALIANAKSMSLTLDA